MSDSWTIRYAAASTAAGSTAEPVTTTSTGSPACSVRATSAVEPSQRRHRRAGRGLTTRPQHAEGQPELVERVLARGLDRDERGRGLVRMGRGDVRARAGLDVDRGEAVGDDVVQVPGDAQPLLGHEPARLLLAGFLQVLGPFLQAEQVRPGGSGPPSPMNPAATPHVK